VIFEKKRVMLLNWPLLDVGGITTWADQIRKGFEQIGWVADHYYCTRTGRISVSEDRKTFIGRRYKRGEKLESKSLGFCGEERLDVYRDLIRQYDYVIFVHPSPHPTKGNLAQDGIEDWKNLFIECEKPKVVVFHDKKWHRTNKWFADVKDHIDICLADQNNFIDSVKEYASLNRHIKYDWLHFPFEIPPKDKIFRPRDKKFCMMAQWIKWKNHHLLFEELEDVLFPIHFYNGGMQYHYIVKRDEWKRAIFYDHVEEETINEDAIHEYHGFVTYDDVKEVYYDSMAAIDLTTRTYQNFTHHEPALYGSIICCTEACREGPYNHIPDNHYWSVDMNYIAESLNELMKDENKNLREDIRNRAYDYVAEHFDCRKIAQKINNIVSTL